jgi:hypothetical protein
MKPDPDQETIIALKAQIAAKKKGRPKGNEIKKNEQWKTKAPKQGESGKKVVTVKLKKVMYYWYPIISNGCCISLKIVRRRKKKGPRLKAPPALQQRLQNLKHQNQRKVLLSMS